MPPCISFVRVSSLHCMSSSPLFCRWALLDCIVFVSVLTELLQVFCNPGLSYSCGSCFRWYTFLHCISALGLEVIPQSVNVGVNCELFQYVVWHFLLFSFCVSAFFHMYILRFTGFCLDIAMLESTKTISWSLMPGIALHLLINDGRFVKKYI